MMFFCLSQNVNYVAMPITTLKMKIKNDLEMDFMILQKWFHENHMVLNPDKCHNIVIGDDDPTQKIILDNNEIASSNEEKPLGILLDSNLNFNSQFNSNSLCKQAKNIVLLQE